jgi:hypothetical protein
MVQNNVENYKDRLGMCCVDQIAKLPISQVWILERFGWILAEARLNSEKICDAIATPVITEPLRIV